MSTLICDSKLLKKLAAISSSLKTIRNVIYFEEDDAASDPNSSMSVSNWAISSFSKVEQLGKDNPIQSRLPIKKDIAVIMYTSGSTGLPKVGTLFSSPWSIYYISPLYTTNSL